LGKYLEFKFSKEYRKSRNVQIFKKYKFLDISKKIKTKNPRILEKSILKNPKNKLLKVQNNLEF
jgi:hypothetical protein